MQIGGLQKLTLIDYPGKLACTVFFVGCNFRCPFCHNSQLVLEEGIKEQPNISEAAFLKFIKERKGLMEGVCLTGGEPTLQNDLPDFMKKIKKLGFLVKLDTNGSNPEMLKIMFKEKIVDYIAMDVKSPLKNEKYDEGAGVKVDLEKIKKSIELVKNSGVDYEFRTTVVPLMHTKEDILQIAKDIYPAKKYFLQNFKPEKTIDQKLAKLKPYPKDFLLGIQKSISPLFEICQVR